MFFEGGATPIPAGSVGGNGGHTHWKWRGGREPLSRQISTTVRYPAGKGALPHWISYGGREITVSGLFLCTTFFFGPGFCDFALTSDLAWTFFDPPASDFSWVDT